jgi:hypothetical protein
MHQTEDLVAQSNKHNIAKVLLYFVMAAVMLSSVSFDVYTQGATNDSEVQVRDPQVLEWTRYILYLTAGAIGAAILGVIIDMLSKSQENKKQQKDIIKAVLNELKENKKTLFGNVHERINYVISKTYGTTKQVGYVNAYLELDTYESVLRSGLIKHLPLDIQTRLTMLYSRIRSRNDLIAYTERFEDMFFIYDDSEERLNRWYKKIQKYDILLTEWEAEIIDLLEETIREINKKGPDFNAPNYKFGYLRKR